MLAVSFRIRAGVALIRIRQDAGPASRVRPPRFKVSELGLGKLDVWYAELGVEQQGLLPVAVGLAGVAGGVVDAGQAVVGAGLLVPVADVGGDGQRGRVLGAPAA